MTLAVKALINSHGNAQTVRTVTGRPAVLSMALAFMPCIQQGHPLRICNCWSHADLNEVWKLSAFIRRQGPSLGCVASQCSVCYVQNWSKGEFKKRNKSTGNSNSELDVPVTTGPNCWTNCTAPPKARKHFFSKRMSPLSSLSLGWKLNCHIVFCPSCNNPLTSLPSPHAIHICSFCHMPPMCPLFTGNSSTLWGAPPPWFEAWWHVQPSYLSHPAQSGSTGPMGLWILSDARTVND